MVSRGLVDLGGVTIGAAQSSPVVITQGSYAGAAVAYAAGLDGLLAATLFCDFTYVGGGTDLQVYVETSLDQAQTWLQVARFDFALESARKVANLSGLLSKAVTAYAALGAEGVNDGILGPLWRCSYTSTGDYTGATRLAVRMATR